MQNKKSIWSTLILIATIASCVLLVVTVTLTAIGIGAVTETAKQAAIDQGVPEADIQLAVSIAVGAVIAALVFSSIFDVLKIIGGFMFSLKGRWGIFCIVVSILSVIGSFWTFISDITNKAGAGTIVVAVVSLLVSILLVVACFMHYKENKQAA